MSDELEFSAALSAASQAALTDLQSSTVPAPEADQTAIEVPASAVVETTVETPAAETAPVEEAQGATETPAAEAQEDKTQPPSPPEQATQKWTFTRKGQQVEITDPAQASELIRQGYDYTQKTMELAEQRRALEAEYERKVQEARAFLANPDNLRAHLQRLEQVAPPALRLDPDALPSNAEVQAQLQASLAETQARMIQETERRIAEAQFHADVTRYKADYDVQVESTLRTLVTEKFPILQDVEDVSELIRAEVHERIKSKKLLEPEYVATIEDAKKLMVASAERRAAKLDARVREHLKMETVRAAKTKATVTEPAGGAAPPPPAPTNYKLGDKALTQSVIAELQAAFDKKR